MPIKASLTLNCTADRTNVFSVLLFLFSLSPSVFTKVKFLNLFIVCGSKMCLLDSVV